MNLFFGLAVATVLFIFFTVWRDVFKKWGIGERPQKCLLSLNRSKDGKLVPMAIPMSVFKSTLKTTVDELRSDGMSLYLMDNNGAYTLKKSGSKLAAWFESSSLCYLNGDIEGILMMSFTNQLMFNRFIIEGNYFVSRKKTQENNKFFIAFVACLEKNLTQVQNSLADDVEIVYCND